MSSISLIEYCGCGMYRYIDSDGIEHILREPVKCKDCKYWQEPVEQDGYKYPSQCTRDERAYMEECAILMDADDFCSKGDKKDATD